MILKPQKNRYINAGFLVAEAQLDKRKLKRLLEYDIKQIYD